MGITVKQKIKGKGKRIPRDENIGDISRQLGHSSIEVKMDIYHHWIPEKKKDEFDAPDDPE